MRLVRSEIETTANRIPYECSDHVVSCFLRQCVQHADKLQVPHGSCAGRTSQVVLDRELQEVVCTEYLLL